MPKLVAVLRNHVEYAGWATQRLLEAAAPLSLTELTCDFGTADKSVLGTCLHLYRTDRIWLERMDPAALHLEIVPAESAEWPALASAWSAVQTRWIAWCATLATETAEASFQYNDMKGTPRESAYWEAILHWVNHGTHHRGQVSGFLRALGQTPPTIDFIAYQRGMGR